jgi:hypothetical protein
VAGGFQPIEQFLRPGFRETPDAHGE